MITYLFVNRDGTECCSNSYPFKPEDWMNRNHQNLSPNILNAYVGKWYTTFSNGDIQVPRFNGVYLPKGTIKKLIGKELTYDDDKYELTLKE